MLFVAFSTLTELCAEDYPSTLTEVFSTLSELEPAHDKDLLNSPSSISSKLSHYVQRTRKKLIFLTSSSSPSTPFTNYRRPRRPPSPLSPTPSRETATATPSPAPNPSSFRQLNLSTSPPLRVLRGPEGS